VIAVVSAAAIPQALTSLERARTRGATRYLCARMAAARAEAVARGATVALRFEPSPAGITWTPFLDGNRNGVLARDISDGIDQRAGPSVRFADLFAHVTIALSSPAPGNPVQLSGGTDLLSFTSVGTATAGSIYIRGGDGTQFAIRVLGVTARTRIQQYDERQHVWVDTR
jgi:Tfp pilus assembly protein FimT